MATFFFGMPAMTFETSSNFSSGVQTLLNTLCFKTSGPCKSTNPLPLTESEREELIRLRAENEYIKAENEVIKKRIALRQEKWAAQLKAKKQQSSKNSEKRDTN